ncbi:MAG: efflux RND transporter periplasmic adaptor subunit [Pirellulales bacterium]|nr:efflux RND transporter periplasmic adaptor subunit [Pirellulales bacterium]
MRGRGFAIFAGLLACALAVAMAVGVGVVWQTRSAAADPQEGTGSRTDQTGEKRVPVVLTPARAMTFESCVVVSGSVHAKQYAMVSARIPGTLDEVFVDEGDRVEAGTTKLFQTDSLKLSKAVAIARQDLAVAEASVQEKLALVDKDVAAHEQALNDLNRYRELLKTNAIAAQVVEQQESKLRQCDADVKHTQALTDLSKAQQEQARLNLTIAEKDLADSLVLAPISGWISERFREPGEMAGAGTPVLRIEDTSVVEISVFLPEEHYAHVLPGKTKMRVRVGSIDLGEHTVSYKSPTVNQKLRTFAVKGLVESPPEGVVPGCLAQTAIVTDSGQGIGVPSEAVQTRGGKSIVFTLAEGRAKMVPVETGRDLDGWREILDGLNSGVPVVSMGQFLVEEGTPVAVVGEDAP